MNNENISVKSSKNIFAEDAAPAVSHTNIFLRKQFLLNFFWFNTPQLAVENWGVWEICSPTYAKNSRRNLKYLGFAPGILYFFDYFTAVFPSIL
jgi:hypothetical protein